MKTFFSTLILLACLAACNSTDEVGLDGLSEADKAYYRAQALKKCQSDTEKNFEDFVSDSNKKLDQLREKNTWNYSYKQGNDFSESLKIQVWKETANTVYLIQTKRTGSDSVEYKFIRISKAENEALIQLIRSTLCSVVDDEIEVTNSNPPTVKETGFVANDSTTKFKVTSEYKFKSDSLAYIGQLYKTVRRKKVDLKGRDLPKPAKTETFSSTVSFDADSSFAFTTYTQYESAANSDTQYCVIPTATFTIPYVPVCNTDPAVGPAGWANPGAEL